MANLKKVQIQLLNAETGAYIEDVTPLTEAYSVIFSDGKTLEEKLLDGSLKGDKGDAGDAFKITKTYASVDEMNADFSNADIEEGSFVLINTNDVEDPDNAKLYVKGADAYGFIADLSGATGIKGDKGDPGTQIYTGTGISGEAPAAKVFANSLVTKAAVNDLYFNTDTGEVYKCVTEGDSNTAEWIKKGSIKGADGIDGSKIISGTDLKTSGLMYTFTVTNTDVNLTDVQPGYLYLNTTTFDIYSCTAIDDSAGTSTWKYVCTIKDNRGSGLFTGTVITKSKQNDSYKFYNNDDLGFEAIKDDLYLNNETFDLYKCIDAQLDSSAGEFAGINIDKTVYKYSKWDLVGNIKGNSLNAGTASYSVSSFNPSIYIYNKTNLGFIPKKDDLYLNTDTFDLYKCTYINVSETGGMTLGGSPTNYSSWIKVGNIKGIDGQDGTSIYSGTIIVEKPSESHNINNKTDLGFTPKVGDIYLNTDTYYLYKCININIDRDGNISPTNTNYSDWETIGNIKGDNGADGTVFITGTVINFNVADLTDNPDLAKYNVSSLGFTPKADDLYLNTNTCDLYKCKSFDAGSKDSVWDKVGNIKGVDGTNGNKWVAGNLYSVKDISDNFIVGAISGMEDGDFYFNTTTHEILKYTSADTRLTLISELDSNSAPKDVITVGSEATTATPVKIFLKVID